jgi:hypothetical protein
MSQNGGFHNSMSGSAGQLVQAGTIRGDVHLHTGGPSRLDAAAQELARLILRQAQDEAAARGLFEVEPLPTLWRVADDPVAPDSRPDEAPGTASAPQAATSAAASAREPRLDHVPAQGEGTSGAAAQVAADRADNSGDESRVHRFDQVVEAFTALRRPRLVLIGGPGSGKTTLALQLALQLLGRRESDARVPVLVAPDSWAPEREHLRVWLTRRLTLQYPQIDTAYGEGTLRNLVDIGRVFPVIDGYDELPRAARIRVMDALSRNLAPHEAVILTSRPLEYEDAARAVDWQPGLILQALPIDARTACDHLTAGSSDSHRWRVVADRLRDDPSDALATTLTTPLMVWLVRRVYGRPGTDPSPLVDRTVYPDAAALQGHLLDALIPAVFDDLPAPTSPVRRRWNPQRAQAYLRYLARRYSLLGERDLSWWRAAPEWAVAGGLLAVWILCDALGAAVTAAQGDTHSGGFWLACPMDELIFTISLLCYWIVDRAVTATLITADDRLLHKRALAIAVPCLAAALAVGFWINAHTDIALVGVGAVALLPVVAYRAVRMAVHPARAHDARARLRRERRFFLFCIPGALFACAFLSESVRSVSTIDFSAAGSPKAELIIDSAGTAAVLLALITPWGRWQAGRAALAAAGRVPWRTLVFFDDCRALGVLRTVDGTYQFRHAVLQTRLAGHGSHGLRRPGPADHSASTGSGADPLGRQGAGIDESLPLTVRRDSPLPAAKWQWRAAAICLIFTVVVGSACRLSGWPVLIPTVLTLAVCLEWWLIAWSVYTFRLWSLLGWSAESSVGPDQIVTSIYGETIRVAPYQVAKLAVRPVETRLGRRTRSMAVQALLYDNAGLPKRIRISRDGWVVLIPLDRRRPLTVELSAALERFAGSRWETPVIDH